MKKIDILNFITSFRKSPNDIKTYQEILANTGGDEQKLNELIAELKQTRVLKEIDSNGEKSYQVVTK
jgi:pyruvate kinase